MRLQRDVTEILERQDAELVGVAEQDRHRQRHLLQQFGDVGERQCRELERSGMQREHEPWAAERDDAEVPAVRRIAGQRNDARALVRETAIPEITGDPIAQLQAVSRSLVHFVLCARAPTPAHLSPLARARGGGQRRLFAWETSATRIAFRWMAPDATRTRSVMMQSSMMAFAPTSTSSHRIDRTIRAVG